MTCQVTGTVSQPDVAILPGATFVFSREPNTVPIVVTVRPNRSYRALNGSKSLIPQDLWSGMRASVSTSHDWGSTPLSLAVSIGM